MDFSSAKVHRRFNPLLGEWVLVSPHRTKRPWKGQVEQDQPAVLPSYEPSCYLCPGNKRANGTVNPPYTSTFVFPNDFAAIYEDSVGQGPLIQQEGNKADSLFVSEAVTGTCRVMCFSPCHRLSLAEMSTQEIEAVIEVWKEQVTELQQRYSWVQIFENKGAAMGCSNPHPHCQVWAQNNLPNIAAKETMFLKHACALFGQVFITVIGYKRPKRLTIL